MPSLIERPAGRRPAGYSPSTQIVRPYDHFGEVSSTRTMVLARPAGAHHCTRSGVCELSLAYESSSVIHQALKSSSTTYLKERGAGDEEIPGSEDAHIVRLPPKRRMPLIVQVATRRRGRITNYDHTEIDL
ncbi:MAG TPA: hypothetical protein PLD13_05255 [Methanoculleus sp.]|nr:hypothetical protein [Methanoculleus sp.]